jgi:hypothetical protein
MFNKIQLIITLSFFVACSSILDMNCEKKVDYSGTWAHTQDVCTGLGDFLCDGKSDSLWQYVQFTEKNSAIVYAYSPNGFLPFQLPDSIVFDSSKYYVFHLNLTDGYGVKYSVIQGQQYYYDFECATMFFAVRSNPPEISQNSGTGHVGYLRGLMKYGYSKISRINLPSELPSYWPKDSVIIRL